MKKLLLMICLAAIGQLAQAQDNSLMGRSGRFGVFVSPMIESGPIAGDRSNLVSGGLAFVFGNGFIGTYATAGVDIEPLIDGINPERIDMGQVGLWLGYTPGQSGLIHPVFDLKAGWAAIDFDYDELDEIFINDFFDVEDFDEVDNAFVLHPSAGLELNVARFLRVNFNAGYRWTEGVNQPSSSDSDFSGWTYTLGLKVGFFGRDHRHSHHHHYW